MKKLLLPLLIITVITSCTKNKEAAFPVVITDVYVAGTEFTAPNPVAKRWKNGVAVNLSNKTMSGITSVFVHTH